jgi:hypothetical protein
MQQDTLATVDTLTQAYNEIWDGAASTEDMNAILTFMYSNDLIFVVLGVTLIIWCVLLFFLFRVDKKVSQLENQLKSDEE